MTTEFRHLEDLIQRAKALGPIRIAVVGAGEALVLQGLQQAKALGLVEPCLIGDVQATNSLVNHYGWDRNTTCITAVEDDAQAAAIGARLVREGRVDAVMKGNIHTDVLMRALLHETNGLRVPGRRASHVFVVDIPSYPKLLCITDAAVNIAPDLNAKMQILQNAAEITRAIGIGVAKAAILSAVETVNPAIASTIDAAALTMMARRGQITGLLVDGPLAFDNAISASAANEKGIISDVAGNADIILVPDLVSGNILAKNLEYFAGATLAGVIIGLAAPVILTSRADPVPARVASIALAIQIHTLHRQASTPPRPESASAVYVTPQPEPACCPPSN